MRWKGRGGHVFVCSGPREDSMEVPWERSLFPLPSAMAVLGLISGCEMYREDLLFPGNLAS